MAARKTTSHVTVERILTLVSAPLHTALKARHRKEEAEAKNAHDVPLPATVEKAITAYNHAVNDLNMTLSQHAMRIRHSYGAVRTLTAQDIERENVNKLAQAMELRHRDEWDRSGDLWKEAELALIMAEDAAETKAITTKYRADLEALAKGETK